MSLAFVTSDCPRCGNPLPLDGACECRLEPSPPRPALLQGVRLAPYRCWSCLNVLPNGATGELCDECRDGLQIAQVPPSAPDNFDFWARTSR